MKRAAPRILARQRGSSFPIRLTTGGLFFIMGVVVIGLAGLDAGNNLLMMLFSLCLAALAVNLFSGWRTLRALSVGRTVPDVLVAGQPFVIRYALTNGRRWHCARCIHLIDELPPTAPMASPEVFVPLLRPGETVTLNVPAVSRRRGRVRFSNVRIATRFPFGVFTKRATLVRRHEVAVFPALGRLQAEVKVSSRSSDASTGGAGSAASAGDEEFYGVREYRIGDNPRRIHWRRSARTGQLMIREMARTREHQLWCVVNTRIDPRDPAQADRLELAISCAATVLCDALERGVKIGLMCNGEPLLVLPPAGGRARRPRLLRELAIREPNVDDPLAPHVQRLSWPARWRGPCMVFSAVEDDDLAAARRLLSRAVGSTTTHIPGVGAFDALFRLAESEHADRTGAGPARTNGDAVAASGAEAS